MTYEQTGDYVRALGLAPIELCEGRARVLVSPIGARVLAIDGGEGAGNPLFIHPELVPFRDQLTSSFVGGHGIGGDRLWLSPEYRYYWKGEPSLADFRDYQPPPAMDPGSYQVTAQSARSVEFSMTAELPGGVRFQVSRAISLQTPQQMPPGVSIVGLRYRHDLALLAGPPDAQLGLWSVLQVPAGSRIIVPTHSAGVRPLACVGSAGSRILITSDSLLWNVTGDAFAKIALRAPNITGHAAVWQDRPGGQATLLAREFPVFPHLTYGDALVPGQVGQQAVQIFDGLGYGELETHSPCLDQMHPAYSETTLLWAISGPADAVRRATPSFIHREINP